MTAWVMSALLLPLVHADGWTEAKASLSANFREVQLWSHLLTLPDPEGQLTPEQVATELTQGHGQHLLTPDQSYGRWLPYPYWAGWQLHNPEPQTQTWLLSFVLPTQDSTALWQQTNLGHWQALNEWRPDGASAWFGGYLWPVWQVTLQPGETQRFILRIDGLPLQRCSASANPLCSSTRKAVAKLRSRALHRPTRGATQLHAGQLPLGGDARVCQALLHAREHGEQRTQRRRGHRLSDG